MIALLRNPTGRAISHYFHELRRDREPLPISEAMQQEDKRLASALETGAYDSDAFVHYSYKRRGLYREQIERYLERFPRSQLLVISSEGFFEAPRPSLARTFEFLGVDADYEVRDLAPRNVHQRLREVDGSVREELDDFFRPHNEALYELLDQDLGWQ